ncbi:DUF1761 domain-containing protein [Sphingomicrobium flavum]|uniref:DUF1761 domain-containing protein n=1 Tax=Sphingomicrobium flavum TaxID=1229164 RepID=UPI0021AE1764|nr:DUF1761 domain-containing protein [Sphingomicrobium flavum]
MEINWIAVLVASVSAFILGGIWYGPLFGKKWMELVGMTEEKIKDGNMAMIYGPVLIINIFACATFSMFLGNEIDWQTGALYGFTAGLFWVAGAFGVQYLFERRPLSLWLINGGYNIVQFTLFGAILAGL